MIDRDGAAASAIVRRVVVEGWLELRSAMHLGAGDGITVDRVVARDHDGRPFIPGTSLAGACRALLRCRVDTAARADVDLLFGAEDQGQTDTRPSCLIVDDAVLEPDAPSKTGVRDGIAIDRGTGVVMDQRKYDYEVVTEGRFRFRIELVIRTDQVDHASRLCALLQFLIELLADEQLRVGARTRRGLGALSPRDLVVREYDYSEPSAVKSWLADESLVPQSDRLLLDGLAMSDVRNWQALDDGRAVLRAVFRLGGPILIRSVPDPTLVGAPDVAHATTLGRPAVLGTGLAGSLRGRAARIVTTLAGSAEAPAEPAIVQELFGHVSLDKDAGAPAQASRLTFDEAVIEGVAAESQSRIRIDRITGAVTHGALFQEMPAWPRWVDRRNVSSVVLTFAVHDPRPEHVGLLLLLVKDLWTGDLAVGGGASIGRGVFEGVFGRLRHRGTTVTWQERNGKLHFKQRTGGRPEEAGGAQVLEGYVVEFVRRVAAA